LLPDGIIVRKPSGWSTRRHRTPGDACVAKQYSALCCSVCGAATPHRCRSHWARVVARWNPWSFRPAWIAARPSCTLVPARAVRKQKWVVNHRCWSSARHFASWLAWTSGSCC
jgi:hypothetical protein